MRILLWSELFWPVMGGASRFSLDLAAELRVRGHEVLVITRQDDAGLSEEDEYRGVRVWRFPFHGAVSGHKVDDIARLRLLVSDLRVRFAADLVHTTSFGPSMWFEAITEGADGAPRVLSLFGEELPDAAQGDSTLHRSLRSAAWVTAPSQATLEYALRLVPQCRARSSVIPVGCPVPESAPRPARGDAPLLCIGRLVRGKGFDIALNALPTILAKRPETRLRIAGDGPERGCLAQQAAQLGVAHAVEFLGWVPLAEIGPLLASSSILLIPSRVEALPLVGIHAALAARPVVASAVGIPELVVDRETGILVEPEAPEALAEAVLGLLAAPDEVLRLGQAARVSGLERYRLERVVDAFEALYETIVVCTGTTERVRKRF